MSIIVLTDFVASRWRQ